VLRGALAVGLGARRRCDGRGAFLLLARALFEWWFPSVAPGDLRLVRKEAVSDVQKGALGGKAGLPRGIGFLRRLTLFR